MSKEQDDIDMEYFEKDLELFFTMYQEKLGKEKLRKLIDDLKHETKKE